MNYENIYIEEENHSATITLNRPKKLNALNKRTIEELHVAFTELDEDPETRAIILTGKGEKAFAAGADIAEFAHYSEKEGRQLAEEGQRKLFHCVAQLSTPVIAAINGFALGGGLELALSCHFRLASTHAKMGLPEVSLGVIPGYGGTQRLPQLIGKGRALEMILTAGMIDAGKALDYGLVNDVVSPEALLPQCRKIASKIAANAPVAIKYAIKAVNAGFMGNDSGYTTEIEAFGRCFGTDDFKEGTTAFLEKRKANFSGS